MRATLPARTSKWQQHHANPEIRKMANNIAVYQQEANNLIEAANEESSQKLLKFKKGKYYSRDEEVPIGTEYLAHPSAWLKSWLKFVDKKKVVQHIYNIAKGERPPQREELGDLDEAQWPAGLDGRPADPWVSQSLLSLQTGEIIVFVASSQSGRRAIADLCRTCAHRNRRGNSHQPFVRLEAGKQKSPKFGEYDIPVFKITAWEGEAENVLAPKEIGQQEFSDDLNDSIPFE
jgi:hypothetical protein